MKLEKQMRDMSEENLLPNLQKGKIKK